MIRIRLSEADLNSLLARVAEAEIRYHDGGFRVAKRFGPLRVSVQAHLDLRDHHVRVALPFNQMKVDGAGALLGRATALIWPRWLEPWLERLIGDKLAEHGLPWDLVWVDTANDPDHGLMGLVSLSPRILNDWLRDRPERGELAPRLVSLDVDRGGIGVGLALVARREAAPEWHNGAGGTDGG